LDTQLKISEFDQGFLVGLIEGEGSLTITKCSNYRGRNYRGGERYINYVPRLTITNASYELVVLAHKIIRRELGIGHIYMKHRIEKSWKQCYYLDVRGLKLLPLMKFLESKLISKRRHAQILVKWCEQRISKQSRKYTEDDYHLVEEIRELNKKGAGYIG